MQDEVVFPAFGIDKDSFWSRCSELVRDDGYDNELAYMKVLLDTLGMDRPTNAELKELGAKLNFYKGLPEMFEEFAKDLLTRGAPRPRDHRRALHHLFRDEDPDRRQPPRALRARDLRVRICGGRGGPDHVSQTRHQSHPEDAIPFPDQQRPARYGAGCERSHGPGHPADAIPEHDLHRRRADRCALLHRHAEKPRPGDRGLQSGRSRARRLQEMLTSSPPMPIA